MGPLVISGALFRAAADASVLLVYLAPCGVIPRTRLAEPARQSQSGRRVVRRIAAEHWRSWLRRQTTYGLSEHGARRRIEPCRDLRAGAPSRADKTGSGRVRTGTKTDGLRTALYDERVVVGRGTPDRHWRLGVLLVLRPPALHADRVTLGKAITSLVVIKCRVVSYPL